MEMEPSNRPLEKAAVWVDGILTVWHTASIWIVPANQVHFLAPVRHQIRTLHRHAQHQNLGSFSLSCFQQLCLARSCKDRCIQSYTTCWFLLKQGLDSWTSCHCLCVHIHIYKYIYIYEALILQLQCPHRTSEKSDLQKYVRRMQLQFCFNATLWHHTTCTFLILNCSIAMNNLIQGLRNLSFFSHSSPHSNTEFYDLILKRIKK